MSDKAKGYVVASVVFLAVVYALFFHVTAELRRGCTRLDAVRTVTYRVLSGAERSLRNQAVDPNLSLEEKNRLKNRADAYRINTQKLLKTAAPFAIEEGSPHVDCSRAYPYPWPFSGV